MIQVQPSRSNLNTLGQEAHRSRQIALEELFVGLILKQGDPCWHKLSGRSKMEASERGLNLEQPQILQST